MNPNFPQDTLSLFSQYMKLVGVPSLEDSPEAEPDLRGKTLGIINGSAWTSLWGYYFGRKHLPGVRLVAIGNEAVQLNFMQAHQRGEACPPQKNIDLFASYAAQLVDLYPIDGIVVTCSTMNRAISAVRSSVSDSSLPIVQVDEALMADAVNVGGRTLVIATHGPTVKNTRALLNETATRLGKHLDFIGETVESAFHLLGKGDIKGHNQLLVDTIERTQRVSAIDSVVLAQISMAVFAIEYPDPIATFGVPVFNSGDSGLLAMREALMSPSTKIVNSNFQR